MRDFHNLLGRAGRAGMHTEGSVLFADPDVYDKRGTIKGKHRWAQFKELLNPKNSEPCGSTLLTLFEPFYSDDGKSYIIMEPLDFTRMYIEKSDKLLTLPERFATKHADKKFTVIGLKNQISYKIDLVSSIENFLMAHWDESESELQKDTISKLAESTLAFSLADEEKKKQLVELFLMLAQNIHKHVPDASRREIFGKTLYGVWSLVKIENWISEQYEELASCKNSNELLVTLWEVINNNVKNASFRKCNKPKALLKIAQLWIEGKPFYQLHEYLLVNDVRIIAGSQLRQYKLDHTVDICENAFAFDGTLVISAVIELITFTYPDSLELLSNLKLLQKRLKYGLPNASSISLYELGFSDRVISLNIVDIIGSSFTGKNQAISNIRKKKNQVIQAISKYPSYYIEMLNNLQ